MDFRQFSPCFLIAMPELKDPNFEKTVILLSDYTPEGAVGFVMNRPSGLFLGPSVTLSEGELNPGYDDTPLWLGGPVDPQRIWVIYDNRAYDSHHGLELTTGISLAQDISVLVNCEKTLSEQQIKVINGYAGWGAQQLEAEIAASFWITAPLSRKLIFETPPEQVWDKALQLLGIEANRLVTPPSHFLN